MLFSIARAALLLSLSVPALGQAPPPAPAGPNRFTSEIPQSESQALSGIVEDDPSTGAAKKGGSKSPAYTLYSAALPIPPVAQVKQKVLNPITNKEVWYYEMDIKPFDQQIFPDKSATRLVGYNGTGPGPTIIVTKGTESVVRFVNHGGDRASSIHLHGSPSRAPFDGWAEDTTPVGSYKDYYYPNAQSSRMLWYHDHAIHHTAENAYFGQAGAYIITDPADDALGLPSGYGEFDIPLVLTAKFYNNDGTLQTTEGEDKSVWGDVNHVNGVPWPFMNVQPRKYRFRILNAAVSRNFDLYLVKSTAQNTRLPFQVIASDAGLLEKPVQVQHLIDAVAERYEIVIDFSQYAGQTILMQNDQQAGGVGVDNEFENTDKVMQFRVSGTAVTDTSTVPQKLRTVPFPPASTGIDHEFRFHRSNGQWQINGHVFSDAANRILANVPRGKVEIWKLVNKSGGWTHPIHVHLVDFCVIQRNGRGVEPYEAAGLKDVVWLGKNEEVLVEAHYAPWDGVYMFHCHNLIHEDNDMMAAFNVTQLADLGYSETTYFGNPVDPRWSARTFVQSDWTAKSGPFTPLSVTTRIQEIARQQPYSEQAQVEAALAAAWADGSAQKRETHEELKSKANSPISRIRRSLV